MRRTLPGCFASTLVRCVPDAKARFPHHLKVLALHAHSHAQGQRCRARKLLIS